ncbi:MAG: HEPN domain-containing protein [Ignavibacteriae bacterium]|nr:HEPN domain-containing protein [Ignavibacteriota bacterium]
MTKEENISYWVNSAKHDLETAKVLFESGRYDWCLFIGHLVIEKMLKAHYVNDIDKVPPKLHDLVRLSRYINIEFNEERLEILERFNDFHIEARYPDEKLEFYKICTKEFTESNFNKIEEIYQWLLSKLKY